LITILPVFLIIALGYASVQSGSGLRTRAGTNSATKIADGRRPIRHEDVNEQQRLHRVFNRAAAGGKQRASLALSLNVFIEHLVMFPLLLTLGEAGSGFSATGRRAMAASGSAPQP